MIKIVNTRTEDYHMHCLEFSDGLMSLYDIIQMAGRVGLTKIAVTDHSKAALDNLGLAKKVPRYAVRDFRNPFENEVEVTFGIEADLLNKQGDICDFIQEPDEKKDFIILSAHPDVYPKEQRKNLTEAYLLAMSRFSDKINVLGHLPLCEYAGQLDVASVTTTANHYGIALELNCKYLKRKKLDQEGLQLMLNLADQIYVNSDAHNLYDLQTVRKVGWDFLKQEGIK